MGNLETGVSECASRSRRVLAGPTPLLLGWLFDLNLTAIATVVTRLDGWRGWFGLRGTAALAFNRRLSIGCLLRLPLQGGAPTDVRSRMRVVQRNCVRTFGGLPRPLFTGCSPDVPAPVEGPAAAAFACSAARVFLFLLPGGRPRLRFTGSAAGAACSKWARAQYVSGHVEDEGALYTRPVHGVGRRSTRRTFGLCLLVELVDLGLFADILAR